ncbi:MAG: hypothetical protein ACJ8C4_04060 [Gemmataceae bacterium]
MNLLSLFGFYLAAMCIISIVRRLDLYRAMAHLGLVLLRKYQKLFGRIQEQRAVLFTGSIILPAAMTGVLWAAQTVLTRLIFPHANVTFSQLATRWWALAAVLLPSVAVIAIDAYFLIRVGQIDTAATEKYFQQAEGWIGTWKSKLVRAATFGKIDPHRMVDDEVKKALVAGNKLIHSALWWTVVQTAARLLLGLGLWMSCARVGQLHAEVNSDGMQTRINKWVDSYTGIALGTLSCNLAAPLRIT